MRRSLRSRAVAALAVLGLVVAACGDDDQSGDTTTTAAPAETTAAPGTTAATDTTAAPDTTSSPGGTDAPATTAPSSEGFTLFSGDQAAKVMVLTDVTQGAIAYSAPETYPAVQAALADLPNVEVSVCDAKGDQNEYLNCQRKAVSDGVHAVVVGWSAGAQAGEDILFEAGIPVLGGGAADAPLSYAFTSGLGNYVGLGAGAAIAGCTKLGILHLEGTDFLVDMVTDGARSQGADEVARAAVPNNAPDLSPAIAKLLGAGADCIILSVSPLMLVQAMTAINQSGESPLAAAVGAIVPPIIVDMLGPLSEGLIIVEPALNAADDRPVLEELRDAMSQFDSSAPITVQSTLGFVSGHVLAAAIASTDGEVTSAGIVEALNSLPPVDAGGIVPAVEIRPLNNPALRSYMNPWAIPYQIRSGVPTRLVDDFVDLRPAIED